MRELLFLPLFRKRGCLHLALAERVWPEVGAERGRKKQKERETETGEGMRVDTDYHRDRQTDEEEEGKRRQVSCVEVQVYAWTLVVAMVRNSNF